MSRWAPKTQNRLLEIRNNVAKQINEKETIRNSIHTCIICLAFAYAHSTHIQTHMPIFLFFFFFLYVIVLLCCVAVLVVIFKAYFRNCFCCCYSIRSIFLFSSFQSSITQAITIFFGSNTKTWTFDSKKKLGFKQGCLSNWSNTHTHTPTFTLSIPTENGSKRISHEFWYPNNKVSCIFPMWPFDVHLSV